MELETFIAILGQLGVDDLHTIALDLEAASASPAGEVAWWHATLEIERLVRKTRCSRTAAWAAHRASVAVVSAAQGGGLDLPDPVVTQVARAASEVARGLVAGGEGAVSSLLSSWRLPLPVAA